MDRGGGATPANTQKLFSLENRAVHRRHHGGDRGGDPLASAPNSPPSGKKWRCHRTTPGGAPPYTW